MQAQSRVIIENVQPNIEGGRYIAKGIINDEFTVTADIFADGHDVINAHLLYREKGKKAWSETPFKHLGNDAWSASFTPNKQQYFEYKIEAWIDYALTWHYGLCKKIDAGQFVAVELRDGVEFLHYLEKQKLDDAQKNFVVACFELIERADFDLAAKKLRSNTIEEIFRAYPEKRFKSEYDMNLQMYADREKAAFSTWYEFFPRSASAEKGKHGTFKDCEALLPRIAKMGFDTLYFPPVHPIGEKNRKGKVLSIR